MKIESLHKLFNHRNLYYTDDLEGLVKMKIDILNKRQLVKGVYYELLNILDKQLMFSISWRLTPYTHTVSWWEDTIINNLNENKLH